MQITLMKVRVQNLDVILDSIMSFSRFKCRYTVCWYMLAAYMFNFICCWYQGLYDFCLRQGADFLNVLENLKI